MFVAGFTNATAEIASNLEVKFYVVNTGYRLIE